MRGKHETVGINRVYGFYDQVKRRYSTKLWKTFIEPMESLPFAAVIDDMIFCVNSGLSPHMETLYQIQSIKRPISVPDGGILFHFLYTKPDDDAIGWEDDGNSNDQLYFGPDVTSDFLNKHGFTLMILS